MTSQLDREKAIANLSEIREKAYSNADPVLLSEYRKLFRKKFSFFRRSWAAAWLFMYYDQRETPTIKSHSLPEEDSKKLFFSIGKSRRLFPREVISLILSKTSVSREDIGLIRILDNYSFVQIRDKKADEVIEKLNGIKFRGRSLTVNHAKPKADD
jgi:3-phenylpropionate/cinnamic acid dioxygenase small subunit